MKKLDNFLLLTFISGSSLGKIVSTLPTIAARMGTFDSQVLWEKIALWRETIAERKSLREIQSHKVIPCAIIPLKSEKIEICKLEIRIAARGIPFVRQ